MIKFLLDNFLLIDGFVFFFSLFGIIFVASKSRKQLLKKDAKIGGLKKEKSETNQQIAKQETDILLWATLNLRRGLSEILQNASDAIADLSALPFRQRERLLKIRSSASELLKTSRELKERVDKLTDKK